MTSPAEERISDEELLALVAYIRLDDLEEPLHPHTWRLIERGLAELQSLRSAQPASDWAAIVEECAKVAELYMSLLGRYFPEVASADASFSVTADGDLPMQIRALSTLEKKDG